MDQEFATKVVETISKPLVERQRQLLIEGLNSGHFKPIDPMLFHFILLGACDQLFFGHYMLNHTYDIEQIDEGLKGAYTDALLDMTLGGILKPA